MNQYTGIYRRCELWFIRRELEQFGLQPLEGKIIMFLQDNQCTQEDIAAAVSVSRVTVSRILNRWARSDTVALQYRSILLRDPAALEQLCRV